MLESVAIEDVEELSEDEQRDRLLSLTQIGVGGSPIQPVPFYFLTTRH